jgi:hypothetical protein
MNRMEPIRATAARGTGSAIVRAGAAAPPTTPDPAGGRQ